MSVFIRNAKRCINVCTYSQVSLILRSLKTIFTDASKYGWAGVLTQEHTSIVNDEKLTINHPVAYVSGMFHGSQLNWAAMMKEAYAIYMTVKKSPFYLTGADITLRSEHLPLNKFLQKNTLNLHVNNWAVEIESFKIKFVHIAGKDNCDRGHSQSSNQYQP